MMRQFHILIDVKLNRRLAKRCKPQTIDTCKTILSPERWTDRSFDLGFTDLPPSLSADHRQFLTGLVEGYPDGSLMSCPHLAAMPAIRWKLTNLERLRRTNPDKFALQADELKKRFR